MKIYIVTSGIYSAYGICSVFSPEESANNYIKAMPDADSEYSHYEVEEYELDSYASEFRNGMKSYEVMMSRDGTVKHCEHTSKTTLSEYSSPDRGNFYFWHDKKWDKKVYLVHLAMTKDETHAIKIVNEKRAQFIAMNKWPELEKE